MSNRIKKFNELTNELQKTIKEAKDKLLNAIINDNEISKIEKLQLISQNDLFKTDSYIRDPFEEYRDEYIEELKKKGVTNPITDNYIDHMEYDRHRVIDMSELLEYLDDEDDLITIYTNRRTDDKFKISRYEFIDTIYDWCIKNKTIAFENDW
jgi:hypothetical protein